MGLLSLGHSKLAYRADFAVYAVAVAASTVSLLVGGPSDQWPQVLGAVLAGMVAWTAIEYGLHRFVLHGVQPFKGWHAEHHGRPSALICAPTVASASLIFVLVFVPAWWVGTWWWACALTLGVLSGYLGYAITHHATHHWRAKGRWLQQRKRWHAQHHHAAAPVCYGVTSAFWDHAFGSSGRGSVRVRSLRA